VVEGAAKISTFLTGRRIIKFKQASEMLQNKENLKKLFNRSTSQTGRSDDLLKLKS
tara:strand:+ start:468 stop:635 length:168 start_codon:yes stop_codon:yes gene_type:complete